ncbi:MAG: hypothetical protein AAGA00_05190 [Pseudomonadota bacterium]
MNGLSKTCLIAVQLVLASAHAALATPSPAIVISDHIIGTAADSFFVIRTTTLNPPIYYAYHRRLEFVELSASDGSILKKCMLRETEYVSDAGVAPETWTQTETQKPACEVFDMLSTQSAGYITPRSTGPGAFRLTAGGLEAREETSDGSVTWATVMSATEIGARAAKTTSIPATDIPWQTGAGSSGVLSLVGTTGDDQPLHEACKLDPVPVTSRGHERMYVRLLCWSGDDDADGANFYVALDIRQ